MQNAAQTAARRTYINSEKISDEICKEEIRHETRCPLFCISAKKDQQNQSVSMHKRVHKDIIKVT